LPLSLAALPNYEEKRDRVLSPLNTQVERLVAIAMRHLTQAALLAETWRDQGISDDLWQIREELARIDLELLGAMRRRRTSPGDRT
jgi:hypothetical protein